MIYRKGTSKIIYKFSFILHYSYVEFIDFIFFVGTYAFTTWYCCDMKWLWSVLLWRYSRHAWMPTCAACYREPALVEWMDLMIPKGPLQLLQIWFCDLRRCAISSMPSSSSGSSGTWPWLGTGWHIISGWSARSCCRPRWQGRCSWPGTIWI